MSPFFFKCPFRRYCTIKISVICSITKNKKKIEVVFLVLRYFKFVYMYFWCQGYVYRCKCLNCLLQFVVQHEECRCCLEVDRCHERSAEVEKDD